MNQELKDHLLTVAKRLAEQAITHAASIPGNVSGKQREDVAVEYMTDRTAQAVERVDQLVPVLGQYMDLPVVNAAQQRAAQIVMRAFVRQVYAGRELRRLRG